MNRKIGTGQFGTQSKAALVMVFVLGTIVFGATAPNAQPPENHRDLSATVQLEPHQPEVPPGPIFRPRQPVLRSPASFTPDMPLEEAIEILRHSTQPPLNLVVLWGDLENNAGIDKSTPIGIDGLTGIRLRQCIETLVTSLSATAGTKIGYVVRHGVVTIGTVEYLPQARRVTHVYDISDLVAPPSPATGMMPGMGMMGMGMMPGLGMMPGIGMMSGMMPGLGGLGYNGLGSNPGYGGYGAPQGYNNPVGGLPGYINNTQR